MVDELGILPQSSTKRTRRSRATLLESATKPPIRGTSLCRASRARGLVDDLMVDELGILPQSSTKRTRRSRATLLESATKPPIRGTSLCRTSCARGLVDDLMVDEPAILPQSATKRIRRSPAALSESTGAADSRHLLESALPGVCCHSRPGNRITARDSPSSNARQTARCA